ncbi:MAG: hypothetical protein HC892_01555 [Saprospiraceae bacterium]|nr:hypothetical protein [Saprospiraceae bacterium]
MFSDIIPKDELLHLEGNLYANSDGDVVMVDGIMDGSISADGYMEARGKFKKWLKKKADKIGKTKVGKVIRKVRDKAKTALLVVPRGAFLTLLKLNVFGFASEFNDAREKGLKGDESAKKRYEKIKNFWKDKLGGNRTIFEKNVISGSKNLSNLLKLRKRNFKKLTEHTMIYFM